MFGTSRKCGQILFQSTRKYASNAGRNVRPKTGFKMQRTAVITSAPSSAPLSMPDAPDLHSTLLRLRRRIRRRIRRLSMFSRIMIGSFIGLSFVGDYLDRQFLDNSDSQKMYAFLQGSGEESIMNTCRTGDVVIMSRPLLSFNPQNMISVVIRQFICDGPYDHCGIIVCNSRESYIPYIVELHPNYYSFFSAFQSANVSPQLKITPFDERILTSREGNICVRSVSRSFIPHNIHSKFSDWIEFKIREMDKIRTKGGCHDDDDDDYNDADDDEPISMDSVNEIESYLSQLNVRRDGPMHLLKTLWFPGDNTIILRSHIRDIKRKIRAADYEIETQKNRREQAPPNIGLRAVKERMFRVRNTDQLKQERRQHYIELCLKNEQLQKRVPNLKHNRTIASSALVAYFWRKMGILDEDGVHPCEIRPNHLQDQSIGIPLAGKAALGNTQHIKTVAEPSKKVNQGDRIG